MFQKANTRVLRDLFPAKPFSDLLKDTASCGPGRDCSVPMTAGIIPLICEYTLLKQRHFLSFLSRVPTICINFSICSAESFFLPRSAENSLSTEPS